MLFQKINKWIKDETGFAATEFALIFPVLFSLLMGTYDIGQAMIINQKVMTASQIAADLIARKNIASQDDIDNAIEAARLAMAPYDIGHLAYDIISVSFDSDGNMQTEGQETSTNYAGTNDMTNQMNNLANPGEGVLGVTMQYSYIPFFYEFLIAEFNMEEVAYARGRKSPIVYFE